LLLGVSQVAQTRRRTGGESGNVQNSRIVQGLHNKPTGCGASRAYALCPEEEEQKEEEEEEEEEEKEEEEEEKMIQLLYEFMEIKSIKKNFTFTKLQN
jgi:CO dehydrogenase/acetyl-CoA synthase beta subunit